MAAEIADDDAVAGSHASVEIESTQINPGGAAHLLVDTELGRNAFVPHGIVGVVDAAGNGLIAHIDGIASGLGKVGLIVHLAHLVLGACHLSHTGRSCREGILAVAIDAAVHREAGLRRRLPGITEIALLIAEGHDAVRGVVVDDDLVLLPVALTRRIDDGAGILQHGHEIGHDDGLREQVFAGGEQRRTLPAPLSLTLIVVDAVTGPKSEMAPLQSAADAIGQRCILHPRLALVVGASPACLRHCVAKC